MHPKLSSPYPIHEYPSYIVEMYKYSYVIKNFNFVCAGGGGGRGEGRDERLHH